MSNANTCISTKSQAVQFTHTLSRTSKMPCKSYGLPAAECNVGSKLRNVKGSTCEGCYAHKGCYSWSASQNATYKRLDAISNPEWVESMVVMLRGEKLFRWHDSGDLMSMDHLLKVLEVCAKTPDIQHWIPTREAKLIKRYMTMTDGFLPENVTIRMSAAMVDGDAPNAPAGINTSTVFSKGAKPQGHRCSAPQNNGECGDCRACWDRNIADVSYEHH